MHNSTDSTVLKGKKSSIQMPNGQKEVEMKEFIVGLACACIGCGIFLILAACEVIPNLRFGSNVSAPIATNSTSVVTEKTTTIGTSEKLVTVEDGLIRRDTTGIPDDTEWVNLARKVGEEVPDWLVPVQVVKGSPYLRFADEPNTVPNFFVPDMYRGLYVWHQVTPEEVGVMNVVLQRPGKPDEGFTFQKQTLRLMGKIWVLERKPKEVPVTPETAAGEDPPGTKNVTGAPAP